MDIYCPITKTLFFCPVITKEDETFEYVELRKSKGYDEEFTSNIDVIKKVRSYIINNPESIEELRYDDKYPFTIIKYPTILSYSIDCDIDKNNTYLNFIKIYTDNCNEKKLNWLFYLAVFNNNEVFIKYWLNTMKRSANINNETGLPPIYYACSGNKFNIVKLLIENGANINMCPSYISTPLQMACERNDLDMVKYLVENGANINQRHYFRYHSALDIAIKNDYKDIINYLEDNGGIAFIY